MGRAAARSSDADPPELSWRPVDASTWADFERLFESPGGPKYCWCMVWRATPDEARHPDGGSGKACMLKRVAGGTPVGILGYSSGEPFAWCSIAPKGSYRNLTGGLETGSENVWSLACFFVGKQYRCRGFTSWLIRSAAETARRRGARWIEAYPVDDDSPSYRFMGRLRMFRELGFVEIGRAGKRRHIMRAEVDRLRTDR